MILGVERGDCDSDDDDDDDNDDELLEVFLCHLCMSDFLNP